MTSKSRLFLLGLILLGGCYSTQWVGPGDFAQVKYQCMRETGGSEKKPLVVLSTGDTLKDLAQDRRIEKHGLFMACMESKGYTRQRVPYKRRKP